MKAAWFSFPRSFSTGLALTLSNSRSSSISLIHFIAFNLGKKIRSLLVSINQPRNVFVSDNSPSANNLLVLIMSDLSIGSFLCTGLKNIRQINGTV